MRTRRSPHRRRRRPTGWVSAIVSACALAGGSVDLALGQTPTGWKGTAGGGDNNWSNAANWDNGAPGGITRSLFFGQGWHNAGRLGAATANNDISNYDGHRITFEDINGNGLADEQSFTLTGNSFTLFDFGGNFPKVENNSFALQTINNGFALSGGGTGKAEINPVNGDLMLGGSVTANSPLDVFGNNGKTLTFSNILALGSNPLTLKQNSTLVIAGAQTGTGALNVDAGVLQVGNGGNSGSLSSSSLITLAGRLRLNRSDGANLSNDVSLVLGANRPIEVVGPTSATLSGVISGPVGVLKEGTGTLTLSNSNTYTGPTTVSAGTLRAGNANAIGNALTIVLLGSTSGALDASLLTSDAITISRQVRMQSGNTGEMRLGGDSAHASTYSGSIFLGTNSGTQKDVTLVALAGGSVEFSGVINEGTSVPASNVTVGAATHTGTVRLSNVANGYSGITRITNGATLEAVKLSAGASNSSIGNSSGVATNLVLDGGTLRYIGGGDSSSRLFSVGTSGATLDASGSGALSLSGSGTMGFNSQSGARTLTLAGSNAGDNILNAIVGDNGGATSLIKIGAGTWMLSGNSSYTGATTIDGGTLAINGTVTGAGGNVAVNSTAKLAGAGSVARDVNLNSGGTISPNNDIPDTDAAASPVGTLTTNGQTWAGNTTYVVEMNSATGSAGGGYDTLVINGSLDLSSVGTTAGSQVTIRLRSQQQVTGWDPAAFFQWKIASTGGITGFDLAKFVLNVVDFVDDNSSNPNDYSLGVSGNDLYITYVPEPATPLFVLPAALTLCCRRVRRRQFTPTSETNLIS